MCLEHQCQKINVSEDWHLAEGLAADSLVPEAEQEVCLVQQIVQLASALPRQRPSVARVLKLLLFTPDSDLK